MDIIIYLKSNTFETPFIVFYNKTKTQYRHKRRNATIMFLNISKIMLASFYLASASYFIYELYYKRKKEQNNDINEAIMFSYGAKELIKSKYSRYMISRSTDRLLHYLNSPHYTIDICMYVITSIDLQNVIVKLKFRGVKVRVIIDADMAFSNGSALKRLEKHGIEVRWMKSTNIMHHKFCLVDTLALNDETMKCTPFLICGSLNWTNQGLSGNWEDVVITSQREIVEQYKIEFENLWIQFKPIV